MAQARTPITDGAAAKPWVFRYKDLRAWWSSAHYDRPGGLESATPTAWAPESKPIWFTELGCPAIDRGTNQPNVFFDPKSSESFTPHFSRGWRDDAIQRAYLEATYLWWGEAANNPLSSVYGGRMVHVPECAAWTWDARPYPFFPALAGVWTDGANWRLGHWLTGRLGAVSLAALVRHLCLRAGLPETLIDVTGLWGAVEGYAITALESPRASITTLSRHFGFDAVETEGAIRFVMRGRASVATLAPDDLVAVREGDVLELTRGQETELPQALKWQVARADEDYEAAQVEARRITVDTTRIASESFPMAVPPEEAERRCRRALIEAWVGRETAAFRLPPSRLALDPADAIRLAHDSRLVDLRLVSIADAEARGIEAVRQDRATYDLPPGDPRAASLTRVVVFGAPDAVLMDLPQLTEEQPAHRPMVAAHAVPWPGEMAVFRSPSTDGFELLTTFGNRARLGTLVSDFYAGPTSRFDLGNVLVVELLTGTLESVTDLTLFGGANALAVESAPGDRAGGRGGTAGARPVSAGSAPPRPARDRGCHGQPDSGRRAGRRAGHRAGVAADRRGRSRHPLELAHWPCQPPGQRRDLCGADLHARGHRTAAVLGRACRAAVAQAAHARRSDHPLDPPVPRARGGQLGRAGGAAGRGTGSLRSGDPRRCHREADAEHRHHQRGLHRRPAERRLRNAARLRRQPHRPHLPALRPRRAGRAQDRHAELMRWRNEFWHYARSAS